MAVLMSLKIESETRYESRDHNLKEKSIFVLLFSDVFGGPHERRLLNDLMEHYNTLERPVYNESDPLPLLFGLTLQQIIDVVSMH